MGGKKRRYGKKAEKVKERREYAPGLMSQR